MGSERRFSAQLTAALSACEIATTQMNTFFMNLNSEIKGSSINGEEILLFYRQTSVYKDSESPGSSVSFISGRTYR